MRQWVRGTTLAADDRVALLMDKRADRVCLRFALVVRGSGKLIFPEVLLDDWGKETKTFELYGWLQENGDRFPRAEVFGFDLNGRPSQHFVRELDLMARYACYVYADDEAPLKEGMQVEAVLVPDRGVKQPQRVRLPSWIGQPLQKAHVSCWLVKPDDAASFDFSLLGDPVG